MAFQNSLVNDTTPQPYDQLIVLSQEMINTAFYNMWKWAPSKSQLKNFNYTSPDGSCTGTLNAPKISLHVTTTDPELYYFMEFSSGTVSLYTNPPPDNTLTTLDAKGLIFAFPVTLSP